MLTGISNAERDSPLGRLGPLVKLGVATAWLLGLALTLEPGPPLLLAATALIAGLAIGGIRIERLTRRFGPLALAVLGVALTNLLFSASNPDPTAHELARIGPLRLTLEAAEAAAGLAARTLAIVSVGAVFALTTDPTRLVDALVQEARVSPRFAYGALAAYQAVPRLASDLATIVGARRLRGVRPWHPRVLVGLLVRAIRHADQLAIAMDARGFGSGPRTAYREERLTALDAVFGGAGLAILVVALVLAP